MKLLIILILLCCSPVFSIAESAKPVHVISFDDYKTGSAEDWLKGKGFELKEDAQRRKLIDLEIKNDSLAVSPASGPGLAPASAPPRGSCSGWASPLVSRGGPNEETTSRDPEARVEAFLQVLAIGSGASRPGQAGTRRSPAGKRSSGRSR